MSETKTIRLNKALRELNISLDRAIEHLVSKGHEVESRPTSKITKQEYEFLLDENAQFIHPTDKVTWTL